MFCASAVKWCVFFLFFFNGLTGPSVAAPAASKAWSFWPCSTAVSTFSISTEIHHDGLLKCLQWTSFYRERNGCRHCVIPVGSAAPGTPADSKCVHLGESSSTRSWGVNVNMKGCLSLYVCLVMIWDGLQPPFVTPLKLQQLQKMDDYTWNGAFRAALGVSVWKGLLSWPQVRLFL